MAGERLRQTDRHRGGESGGGGDRERERDRERDRDRGRETDRETDRQTGRQRQTQRERANQHQKGGSLCPLPAASATRECPQGGDCIPSDGAAGQPVATAAVA